MARVVQRIFQERRLVDVTVAVVNRPGGGGSIAQAYLQQHAGDAQYLEISATSLLTNHITGKSAYSHKDYTPIVMLSDEYIGFLVREDSPLRTGKDLLEALRSGTDSLPIGIATRPATPITSRPRWPPSTRAPT
jgi:putative tricarboxylic transport membrane protein